MTDSNTTTPAGWYPDTRPGVPTGAEMYWDGAAWRTEMTRTADAAAATPAAVAEPAAKRPWYKRKAIVIPAGIVVGIFLISGIANAVNGGADATPAAGNGGFTQESKRPAEDAAPVYVTVPDVIGKTWAEAKTTVEAAGLVVNETTNPTDWIVVAVLTSDAADLQHLEEGMSVNLGTEAPKPTFTLGQENAISKAQSYLDHMGFSRAGLFGQLTSEYGEQFPAEDAEFALAYLEQNGLVDWNAEAVEKAQSYLDSMSFSRDGLFDQLTSEYGEQFTADQANYALSQVGY